MKFELDLTSQQVEMLKASLDHYGSIAREESEAYTWGGNSEVFYSNSSEILSGLKIELSRQEKGPSFRITPSAGNISELQSPYGIWERSSDRINAIRQNLLTHPGLKDVLTSGSYKHQELREQYANVPDPVWNEHSEVVKIIASDMGLKTDLTKKDLSHAELREPSITIPDERVNQRQQINPDRIRSVLMDDLPGEYTYHHKASNGVELDLSQDGNRVTISRRVDDRAWPVYESHQKTDHGFQPGIQNSMSTEERDATLEALNKLEGIEPEKEVLQSFARGIEQLKHEFPDAAQTGGGAKARIQQHLDTLKRTNNELEALFDRADQIMENPIYNSGRQQNSNFHQAVSTAASKHGVQAYGISKLDLKDGLTLTAIDGEVIISQDNGQGQERILYEQSPSKAHLDGIGYTHTDTLDPTQKASILKQIKGLDKGRSTLTKPPRQRKPPTEERDDIGGDR